ncbi:DUF2336 domain-containing protein [Kordiimonas sp. SCSIO 12610]|uniref:DUF2336 domain-containing protein n=1 Tax=Kordiimonas sp. SCSIO 12610 TaxID=2829597 RepID=UPI00210CED0C|nr:DUF2336 domain-containing protein [Kordiimonas sp. SCSIO 12610]UTW55176.1 DUF2336 domain-containing protein [Kordiimonas sp. SCSIO 12610]
MLSKLKSIFGGQKKLPDVLTTDDEQAILKNGSDTERLALAAREDARPEVLYYLAEDKSADVRKRIANNPQTPVQADAILANDVDEEVRSELARKIGRMIPSLDEDQQSILSDKSLVVLEQLAQDQLPKIRAIIAEEIKKSTIVPKSIIDKLARDVADIVCGPILEYSPLLNEDDLREIIAAGASSGALTAIAKRENLSENVSGDIAASLDVPAIAALLTNESAYIREETLDQIIDQAKSVDDLHRPLALRPQLSIRAMKRIAGFVASALVHAMMEQSDLEEDQAEELLDRVRDRLEEEDIGDEEEQKLAAKALDFAERGLIDDKFLMKEVDDNHREFVIQCLAVIADLPATTIRKIIHSKSGRAVTALSWRAKLSMRTAYYLQTRFALVPKTQLLSAKDGKDYPLDEDELDWHLSYFVDQDE